MSGKKKRLKTRYTVYAHIRRDDRDQRIKERDREWLGIGRPTPPPPMFTGDQKIRTVERIKEIIRAGHSSPLQFEAACRHGIRSALCLRGHSWARADSAAARIIEEVFRDLGVKRPTWEEGQREYVVPRENCTWCSRPVPDELLFGHRPVYYCSEECARATMRYRERQERSTFNAGYQAAQSALQRLKHPAVNCLQCGTKFRPEAAGRQYCSHPCAVEHGLKHPPRPCDHCGQPFKPKNSASRFCSKECFGADEATRVELPCKVCGEPFMAVPSKIAIGKGKFCSTKCAAKDRASNKRYSRTCQCCGTEFKTAQIRSRCCSKRCINALKRIEVGEIPKKATPLIFDYMFIASLAA